MVIIPPKCQSNCVISLFLYPQGIFSRDRSLNFINIVAKFLYIGTEEGKVSCFWII